MGIAASLIFLYLLLRFYVTRWPQLQTQIALKTRRVTDFSSPPFVSVFYGQIYLFFAFLQRTQLSLLT